MAYFTHLIRCHTSFYLSTLFYPSSTMSIYFSHIFYFCSLFYLIYNKVDPMFGRLAAYRLRAKLLRQSYMVKMRRYLLNKRNQIVREKIKILATGIAFGGLYFYGRSLAEYHLKVKKLRRKFLQLYPQLTKIFIFSQMDPYIVKNLDYKIDMIEIPESQEATKIKERLGDTVIMFSPINFDQFCRTLELCHQFKFKVVIGNYKIEDDIHNLVQFQQIPTPHENSRCLIINISNFNNVRVDNINNIVHLDTGCTVSHLNETLSLNGYQPLFEDYFNKINLHSIIENNLPLKNGKSIDSSILNLSLISGEGKRFKSSTSLTDFGQIMNLTPLFVGNGSMAIPAEAKLKISKKSEEKKHYYEIQGKQLQNLKQKNVKVYSGLNGRYILQSNGGSLEPHQNLMEINQTPPKLYDPEIIISLDKTGFTKFLSNQQIQKNSCFIFENNLLFVSFQPEQSPHDLLEYGKKIGGRLIWAKNNKKYEHLKSQRHIKEINPELLSKLEELKRCLDRKKMLIEHDRSQKGFFQRLFSIFVE